MAIRIGTRGSKLALWQANQVKTGLEAKGLQAEIRIYKTQGDIMQDQALHAIGDKGLFTRALDEALIKEEIDIAVHSAKDIPTEFDDRIAITAFMKREDPRDVLLSMDESVDLDNLNRNLVIGTSSLRRQAFLRHYASHVEVREVRGNLDTRVSKMESGQYDALILAYAGVKRMGFTHLVRRKLNPASFTPAAGQGAVAITAARDSDAGRKASEALDHGPTARAVRAERAMLAMMGGGCQTPIFALATEVGQTLSLEGGVAAPDGTKIIRMTMDGSSEDPEGLGERLARAILTKGGNHILHGNREKN